MFKILFIYLFLTWYSFKTSFNITLSYSTHMIYKINLI